MGAHLFEGSRITRVIVEAGGIKNLGHVCLELGARRVLVVSDAGLVQAGHVADGIRALESAGLRVGSFLDVDPNPNEQHVQSCAEYLTEMNADCVVGLGGGSAMDTAKGAILVAAGGGGIEDYWGRNKGKGKAVPLVAVPTTAGTGSETQSFALITRSKDGRKMACGDGRIAARAAILDVELTLSVPQRVAVYAAFDCLAHALESAVSTAANSASRGWSEAAFCKAMPALPSLVAGGPLANALDVRTDLLVGASLAGLAIEASMLGAAHALANALSANYGLDHGLAVGCMLPAVVRFNAFLPDVKAAYDGLMNAASLDGGAEALITELEGLVRQAGLAQSLHRLGVGPSDLDSMAHAATLEWTAGFNPRAATAAEMRTILQASFAPV